MKVVGVVALAALVAVAAAQGTCRCTITSGRNCDTVQLVSSSPDSCRVQQLPCEPCFCNPEGSAFCPTDVVQAYQFTDAPLCSLQETVVARCPESPPTAAPPTVAPPTAAPPTAAPPTIAPPTGPTRFQCIFDGTIPEEDYFCRIPSNIVTGVVTSIDLTVDQTWNATLNAICGSQTGVGSLFLTIQHLIDNKEFGDEDEFDPPFGLGRTITDVDEAVEVVAADQCQGTGDGTSEVERLPKLFTGSRTQSVGSGVQTFVDSINAAAGNSDYDVNFTFEVSTNVGGNLLGSGLVYANTRIVFTFLFNY